jgi:predicted permease
VLHDLIFRLRALLRHRRAEDDMREELQYHLERQSEKYVQAGLPPEEARRKARIALGGEEQIGQQCREARGTRFVEDLVQDLRYSARSLGKNFGFSVVVVLTLALGIGSCTAIFSLITAVLFPPLPYGDPSRLLYLTTPNRQLTDVPPDAVLPDNADFVDLKRQSHSFSAMTQFEPSRYKLTFQKAQTAIDGARVDADFFSTLEVPPELGRTIQSEDTEPGNQQAVVISHSLWQQMFAGNADALGKPLELNGKLYRVIGIMPQSFHYPHKTDIDYGPTRDATEVWIPLALSHKEKADRGLGSNSYALARLRPDVTTKQAEAELNTIMERLNPLHDPTTYVAGWYAYVKPFEETLEGSARPLMLLLMGAVSFVLLIACGNAANLLLARSASRTHELGVRATLGAGRRRLMHQMLTESLLLGIAGGLAGIGLAWVLLHMLLRLDPGNIPRLHEASLNLRVLLFTVSITLLTSIAAGILPALSSSRINLVEFLKSGGQRGATGGNGRFRSSLIVAEVATVVVLLAGAGLLIRSYINLQGVPTGFSPSTLSMKIDLPDSYHEPAQRSAFFRALMEQIRSAPGVLAAGAVNNLPFGDNQGVGSFWVEGYPNQKGQMVDGASTTSRYFSAMGVPVIEGRSFSDHDTSAHPKEAVIDQAFAKKYFAGRDPIGKHVWTDQPDNRAAQDKNGLTVVGVVGDIRDFKLEQPASPQLFQPLSDDQADAYIVVRSLLPPKDVAAADVAILHRIDPSLGFTEVRTMREVVSDSTARRRFQTMVLTIFSAMAFALALVGLYGLITYSVRERRPEMGVRIALGATRGHVMRRVVRQGLQLVSLGLFVGLVMALGLTRLLASSLYGVTALDPVTFITVPALLLLTTIAACLIPARRAANVDPMITLRYE